MSNSDDTNPKLKSMSPLDRMEHWLRRTASSTSDLAMGLGQQEKRAERRHQELTGLVLAILPDHTKRRLKKSKEGREDTDSFKLPGGNSVNLTKTTQHRIVKGVLAVLMLIVSHLAVYFAPHWMHQHEHEHEQRQEYPYIAPPWSPYYPYAPQLQEPRLRPSQDKKEQAQPLKP